MTAVILRCRAASSKAVAGAAPASSAARTRIVKASRRIPIDNSSDATKVRNLVASAGRPIRIAS